MDWSLLRMSCGDSQHVFGQRTCALAMSNAPLQVLYTFRVHRSVFYGRGTLHFTAIPTSQSGAAHTIEAQQTCIPALFIRKMRTLVLIQRMSACQSPCASSFQVKAWLSMPGFVMACTVMVYHQQAFSQCLKAACRLEQVGTRGSQGVVRLHQVLHFLEQL